LLQEGYVQKYKPGMSNLYIQKYLVLHKDSVTIYKSRWQAKLPYQEESKNKTIVNLPISAIRSCQRVNVDLGKSKDPKEHSLFQFEIFLQPEFQDELSLMEVKSMKLKEKASLLA
jgi:hypothetical protein